MKTKNLVLIVRQTVWNKSNGSCWYCGAKMEFQCFTIDHFVPLNKGGSSLLDNLVPACKTCNTVKRDRDIEGFRRVFSGIKRFSPEQLAILKMVGVHDIEDKFAQHASKFVFWFEKEGKQ